MKEKKEKLCEFVIHCYKNGEVKVSGPMESYIFWSNVINRADRAVLNYTIRRKGNDILLAKPKVII